MMIPNKTILNEEQEKSLRSLVNSEYTNEEILTKYKSNEISYFKPLQSLSFDELAIALFYGYEVKPTIKEDLLFLMELQVELETQDHDSQAEPRFWVIMDYRKDTCWEEQAEKYELISPQNDGEVDITKDNLNQEIIDLDLDSATQEEIQNKLNDLDLTDNESVLSFYKEHIDEDAYLVPVKEVNFIVPNTFFITKQEAKDHLKANAHHYSSEAHTYAMSALRAPKVARLWKILESANFEEIY